MELVDHIRKISFIFFLTLGIGHFIAGLLYVNGYYVNTAGLVNRALFIPFVMTMLTYLFANIKYKLLSMGKTGSASTYIFIGIGVIVFAGLIVLEILVPDAPHPLLPSTL